MQYNLRDIIKSIKLPLKIIFNYKLYSFWILFTLDHSNDVFRTFRLQLK